MGAQAKQLKGERGCVVIVSIPSTDFGAGAAGCAATRLLMRLALDRFVCAFFSIAFSPSRCASSSILTRLGPHIDLTTSGDGFWRPERAADIAGMFERFIAPLVRGTHRTHHGVDRRYFWHQSCGSVHDLLDQIIASG